MATNELPSIDLFKMATGQLQRAWALMLVKSLWPTIQAGQAQKIAEWIFDRKTG